MPAPSLGDFEQIVLLAILRVGEGAYGVPIRAEVAACTNRDPAPGALYTTLDRLVERGMVTSRLGDPTPQRGGRAKRFFAVTAAGLAAVKAIKQEQLLLPAATNSGEPSMRREKAAELIGLWLPRRRSRYRPSAILRKKHRSGAPHRSGQMSPELFASQLWRDLCSCPFGLVRLAVSGLVWIPAWSALLAIAFALPAALSYHDLAVARSYACHPSRRSHDYGADDDRREILSGMNWLGSAITYSVAPLVVGHRLAEGVPAAEKIAVALCKRCLLPAPSFFSGRSSTLEAAPVLLHLISDLFLITGAILCRFRGLGRQSEPATA